MKFVPRAVCFASLSAMLLVTGCEESAVSQPEVVDSAVSESVDMNSMQPVPPIEKHSPEEPSNAKVAEASSDESKGECLLPVPTLPPVAPGGEPQKHETLQYDLGQKELPAQTLEYDTTAKCAQRFIDEVSESMNKTK